MDKLTRRGALAAVFGAAACAPQPRITAPAFAGEVSFRHGVASGDPGIDRVVIWTRVSADGAAEAPLRWIVAKNEALTDVVKTGEATTGPARDYTVKVDVTGLAPGQRYFYGFLCGTQRSRVGRTRTLPRSADSLRIAVFSCSNHPFGFFNAYEAMARRDDIDVALHLGDYLYEYGLNGYGGESAIALGRYPRPEVEITTLNDYRMRHAQYKEEPELQAAHAACPWIVTWDDHEHANDAWKDGAENHDPDRNEGAWSDRKKAALQAYFEWMPIRDPAPGKVAEAINRSFQFGDLATVLMLETRLLARTKQLAYEADLGLVSTVWNMSAPGGPTPLPPGAPQPANVRVVPTPFEMVAGQPRPVLDWARVSAIDPRNPPAGIVFMPDVEGFKRVRIGAADRTLLGTSQEQWLAAELAASRAAKTRWQIIGNQAVMARVKAPDLSGIPAEVLARFEKLRPGISQFFALTRFGIPLNLDGWDGYPAQRERLYAIFAAADANAIVVSGDSHDAWANELSTADGKRVAVEFGTTAVTSPGSAALMAGVPGLDVAKAITGANPEVKWLDPVNRGFLVLTLTKKDAQAEFFAVSTVTSKDYALSKAAAFRVAAEEGPGVAPLEKIG